jgi:hypothetical protein
VLLTWSGKLASERGFTNAWPTCMKYEVRSLSAPAAIYSHILQSTKIDGFNLACNVHVLLSGLFLSLVLTFGTTSSSRYAVELVMPKLSLTSKWIVRLGQSSCRSLYLRFFSIEIIVNNRGLIKLSCHLQLDPTARPIVTGHNVITTSMLWPRLFKSIKKSFLNKSLVLYCDKARLAQR